MSKRFLVALLMTLVPGVAFAQGGVAATCGNVNYYGQSFHPGCLSWTDLNNSWSSPPPLGSVAPSAGNFTSLNVSGNLTAGTLAIGTLSLSTLSLNTLTTVNLDVAGSYLSQSTPLTLAPNAAPASVGSWGSYGSAFGGTNTSILYGDKYSLTGTYSMGTPGVAFSVTSSSGTGTVATLGYTGPSHFVPGDVITVTGNGAFNCVGCTVTAASANSVSYASAATGSTTGGSVGYSSTYLYRPELSPHVGYMYYSSGWNQDTADNAYRTGATYSTVYLYQNGQGDLAAYNFHAALASQRAGATNFLAQPAASGINGDMTALVNYVYENPEEYALSDTSAACSGTFTGSISGTALSVPGSVTGLLQKGMTLTGAGINAYTWIVSGSGTSWVVSQSQSVSSEAMTVSGCDIAMAGPVMDINRNNNYGGQFVTVMGTRYQSTGSAPGDAAVSAAGPWIGGIDFSKMTGTVSYPTPYFAATPFGVGWYGNATNTGNFPVPTNNPAGNGTLSVGTDIIVDTRLTGWEIIHNNTETMQFQSTGIKALVPAAFNAAGTGLTVANNATVGGAAILGGVSQPDGVSHAAGTTLEFPTRAAMAAFVPSGTLTSPVVAHTAGFYAPGDGGGGTYAWNSSSAATADGLFYITPAGSASGLWVLQIPTDGPNVLQLGMYCDGSTDDTAALNSINAAMQSSSSGYKTLGGTLNFVSGKSCLINSGNITMGAWVKWTAPGYAGNQSNTAPILYPQILLNHSYTITMVSGSWIDNLRIDRNGLPAPSTMEILYAQLAAWQDGSVGITATGSPNKITNTEVIGFNTGIVSNNAPVQIDNVWLDDINGYYGYSSNDTSAVSNSEAQNYYAFVLSNHRGAWSATVTGGHAGTGYTNGGTVTVSGGTCTTQPTFTVTASGGVVSAATLADTGDCTVFPSNPVSVTGGGGTGLELTVTVWIGSYRPGLAWRFDDASPTGSAFNVNNITTTCYHNGLLLNNQSLTTQLSNIDIENTCLFPDATSYAIKTSGAAAIRMANIYTNGPVLFEHTTGWVNVVNIGLQAPASAANQEMMILGTGSIGTIYGLTVAGPGAGAGYSVVAQANTGLWKINGTVLNTSDGTTTPWINIDPTSVPYILTDVGPNGNGIPFPTYLRQEDWRNNDLSFLVTAPSSGAFGLEGGFVLTSQAANSSTITDYAVISFVVPPTWKPGSTLNVILNADYVLGSGTIGTHTLQVGFWSLSSAGAATGLAGGNTLSVPASAGDLTYAVSGATIVPGGRVYMQAIMTIQDTGGHNITGQINSVRLQ